MTSINSGSSVGRIRKFLVAVLAVIGEILAAGLTHGDLERWLTIGVSVVGALLVYAVPNDPVAVRRAASAGPGTVA